MTTLLFGIPVIRDTRKIHVEKGRRWSVFEHAVLEALARSDYTLDELEKFSNLRARVVVEIIVRLMRAGWVELTVSSKGSLFRATPYGRLNATLSELPPVTKIVPRHLSYAVDLITGGVFRRTDLTLVNETQWLERTQNTHSVRLQEPLEDKYVNVPLNLLTQELLEDDEELVRVDPTDWRPNKLIALASVSGSTIDGLGNKISHNLRKAIEDARRKASKPQAGSPVAVVSVVPTRRAETRLAHRVSFSADDLITGGANHRTAFRQAIRRCGHRLVIHSTFLNDRAVESWWQDLLDAARRDVMIDVLWGQSSEKRGSNDTLVAANRLRSMVAHAGVQNRIRVHASSSRSHAKIVFADTGQPDRFHALIGSCNWLASKFDAFETSVRLRDNLVLADVAFELAELGRPPDWNITSFSTDMLAIGRRFVRDSNPINTNVEARIVLGSEHADLLLRARDEARARIILMSHQLGYAAGPNLAPITTAAKLQSIECQVYYCRFSDGIDVAKANRQLLDLSQHNMKVSPVQRPRLHAKVLTWDQDNIVVTSQNWLSSDPSSENLRQEIGVHLKSPNVARIFRDRFVSAKDFSGVDVL